jgi:hypothetical protein
LAGTCSVPPVLPRDLARHISGALLEVGLAERYTFLPTALVQIDEPAAQLLRDRPYNGDMATVRRRGVRPARKPRSAAARLYEAERLFLDFVELTPFKFTPFVKTFDTFGAYERWKRAQTNPWYR